MSLEPKLDPYNTTLRVHLDAELIPDGETVSKPTGDKLYKLWRELPIYTREAEKKIILPAQGSLFLVQDNAVNEFPLDKPLHWHTTLDNIQMHCESP